LNLDREVSQIEANEISKSIELQVKENAATMIAKEKAERDLNYLRSDTIENLMRNGMDQYLAVTRNYTQETKDLSRRHDDTVLALTQQLEDANRQLTRQYRDVVTKVGQAEADAIMELSRAEADMITEDEINTADTLYNLTNYHNDTAQRMIDNLNNSAPVYNNIPGTSEMLISAGLTAINSYGQLSTGAKSDFNQTLQNIWKGLSSVRADTSDYGLEWDNSIYA
jgi:membrane-bound lytic murein transglycosylase